MPDGLPAHGVVVLAAGASTRLGQRKQLLVHHGETLVRHALRLALETRPQDTVIVLGFDADAVFSRVQDLPVRRIDCAEWRLGLGASLRCGVEASAPACLGVLVVLCDQLQLEVQHLLALRDRWRRAPDRGVASLYMNRLGVPALLARAWFDELDATSDRGMRDLLAQRAARVDTIANEALAVDLDVPDDLRHLS